MARMGGGNTCKAHSPMRPRVASVRTRVKAPQLPHRPSYSLTGETLAAKGPAGEGRGRGIDYARGVTRRLLLLLAALLAPGCAEVSTPAASAPSPGSPAASTSAAA